MTNFERLLKTALRIGEERDRRAIELELQLELILAAGLTWNDPMTLDEKLRHIESALAKIRQGQHHHHLFASPTVELAPPLTPDERDATEAALEIAAAVCQLMMRKKGVGDAY